MDDFFDKLSTLSEVKHVGKRYVMLHCFNLVSKNADGKPPVYLIGSNHGCSDLLEEELHEYEGMFCNM